MAQGVTRARPWRGLAVVWAGVVGVLVAVACSAGHTTGDVVGAGGAGATGAGGGFTGTGGTGGGGASQPGTCEATTCGLAGGQCVENVCVIVENPGGVDAGTQGLLDGGGAADPGFRWLYPYDATVFPRGLLPPTLQFDGAAVDAMRIHITGPALDYTGYFGPSSPVRATLNLAVWSAITLHADGNDVLHVEATKTAQGQVTGPVSESWSIAQGSLRGTIYYETYDSALAGGLGSVGIMKIAPGATQPTVLKTGCGNVCHTASADGSTLVASTGFGFGSASYDLKNNAATIFASGGNEFVYGGIYPDGSFSISATHYRTWLGNASHLYDTTTAAQIPTPSWDGVVTNASMPAFSPDGKFVVFNREDTGGGHSLATMTYDVGSNTFSALTDVASDGTRYLGWPAFTPDSKRIIYHAGSSSLFETDGGATADLYIVDTATKQTARLDRVDGYDGAATYLPASDPNSSFAPTVLPEAVGGYFWVVFTSHRSYGNTLPSMDNNGQNGKLWVAAIDLDAAPGQDASHPAFFLDGQELAADNLRGFWVLDPCKSDGGNCTTGDQCCGGFCTGGLCSSVSTGCSHEFEHCDAAADCCDPGAQCINGKCAQPPPN